MTEDQKVENIEDENDHEVEGHGALGSLGASW